jgi:integrase
MAKHKLEDVHLRNWVRVGQPVAKSDGGGLTFTLSASGTTAWVLRFRFGGRPRELTIGRWPDISLAEARKRAAAARAEIQLGVDVATEKRRSKVDSLAAWTFRQLAEDYMRKRLPAMAASTQYQRRHHIENVILPKLGSLVAREVDEADVVALVKTVGARSYSVAELVMTAVSEVMKHGLGQHVVKRNVCAGLSLPALVERKKPVRQRLKLTEANLRALLADVESIGKSNALSFRILLSTCVRIGELVRAEWIDVDLENAVWHVPDANSKTRKGFTVPLPAATVGWFKQLKELAGASAFVLPARQERRRVRLGGDIHCAQHSVNAILHKYCERMEEKCPRFTPHDLRSTARSHLSAMGVPVVVAERALNHKIGGIIGIYDQHDFLDERREALERWTAFLVACESGAVWNVTPISRAIAA